MSSANLMIELEACMATQSWVNREYRIMYPCVMIRPFNQLLHVAAGSLVVRALGQ